MSTPRRSRLLVRLVVSFGLAAAAVTLVGGEAMAATPPATTTAPPSSAAQTPPGPTSETSESDPAGSSSTDATPTPSPSPQSAEQLSVTPLEVGDPPVVVQLSDDQFGALLFGLAVLVFFAVVGFWTNLPRRS